MVKVKFTLDRQTDGQTNRQIDRVIPIYPQTSFAGGIITSLSHYINYVNHLWSSNDTSAFVACQQRTLTLPDIWFHAFLELAYIEDVKWNFHCITVFINDLRRGFIQRATSFIILVLWIKEWMIFMLKLTWKVIYHWKRQPFFFLRTYF